MKGNGQFSVQMLLSHNRRGSVTRIAADTANIFVRQGVPTTVLFPAVDWWDFKRFVLSQRRGWRKWFWGAKLVLALPFEMLFRRRWSGLRYHAVDARVKARCYGLVPSAKRWKENSVTVVHPPYLMPHLLKSMGDSPRKMVSVIHVNLERAMRSPNPAAAAWFEHWVEMERTFTAPRLTTSAEAQEACERLGIPIRRMIPGGVDLALFRPPTHQADRLTLVVTLYCDPNVQKGREIGVEALRRLKQVRDQLTLRSVGRVTPEQAKVFDQNLGYLHGAAYADALRESDIFVYPSRYDGFPAPPLQAMASGAALVTTAVEGVKEYAADGENCLLAEPGCADSLHRQIVRMVEDVGLRERLRTNGPKAAHRFSMERSAGELLQFLREEGAR